MGTIEHFLVFPAFSAEFLARQYRVLAQLPTKEATLSRKYDRTGITLAISGEIGTYASYDATVQSPLCILIYSYCLLSLL